MEQAAQCLRDMRHAGPALRTSGSLGREDRKCLSSSTWQNRRTCGQALQTWVSSWYSVAGPAVTKDHKLWLKQQKWTVLVWRPEARDRGWAGLVPSRAWERIDHLLHPAGDEPSHFRGQLPLPLSSQVMTLTQTDPTGSMGEQSGSQGSVPGVWLL